MPEQLAIVHWNASPGARQQPARDALRDLIADVSGRHLLQVQDGVLIGTDCGRQQVLPANPTSSEPKGRHWPSRAAPAGLSRLSQIMDARM